MRRNAVAWAALVVSLAALAGSRWSSKPAQAVLEIPAEGQKYAKGLSDAFGAVAEFVRPSVVKISVQKKAASGNFFRPPGPDSGGVDSGTGSGFVYDDDGHILTNNHVVAGADKIIVTFHDGEKVEAKVIGTDSRADVAVIQVENKNYRRLPVGNSEKLRVGEWVLAVGSPFALDQTVTAGIISATERGTVGINEFESFIQTDAAINPGNSGGPLVDLNGHVVGINSAIATASRSSAGVGFAIPMDMASTLADKLIKDGKVNRVRVGLVLKMDALTPSLAKKLGVDPKTHGVIVGEVAPGSPGEKAGIQAGDIVTEFNGHTISTVAQFRTIVSVTDEGKNYDLKYFRNGKAAVASIAPAAEKQVMFAHERQIEKTKAAMGLVQVESFGLTLFPATEDALGKLGYPEGTQGLIVAEVARDGAADKAGLEPGDLISGIVPAKGEKPQNVKGTKDFLSAIESKDEILLTVRNIKDPEAAPQPVTLSKKVVEKDVDR